MNRDFTKKKAIFVCKKKKKMQRVAPEKKILAQAVSKKTNSCKLKISLPPITFLMVRPLRFFRALQTSRVLHNSIVHAKA